MKILVVILLFCVFASAEPKLTNFGTGNEDPVEELEGLSEDEEKIAESLRSDPTDELEEDDDDTAAFGNELNDPHHGGEGSGVSPKPEPPPRRKSTCRKYSLAVFLKIRRIILFKICPTWCARNHRRWRGCRYSCAGYCLAHPCSCGLCPKKKKHDEQETSPFVQKESAGPEYNHDNQYTCNSSNETMVTQPLGASLVEIQHILLLVLHFLGQPLT